MSKAFLPKSLFGRFLLIILLPNIIVQLVTVYMFYERHWSGVSKHMAVGLVGDISMIVNGLRSTHGKARAEFLNIVRNNLYLTIDFVPKERINLALSPLLEDVGLLTSEVDNRIKEPHIIYAPQDESKIAVDVQMPDGLLKITISRKRIANPSTYIFIMWMTGTALLFLLISILFMRNQVRAISQLAEVADKFGKGQDTVGFKPSGATEVRRVARAFVDMRNRINRQVEQRTEMLAGVSHDLRTPLTRIKLQLAMMESSKEIRELADDISEMQKMIQGYLDFAKGNERVIDAAVNIPELLESIVTGYRHQSKPIALETASNITLQLNANAFRRVMTNLIDNGLRYGNHIRITLNSTAKNMILMVEDDGPGIPAKNREMVFKPFYRLDPSRHIESGNTGLGLSISRDIITSYGGTISLEESALGGLKVVIKLPL